MQMSQNALRMNLNVQSDLVNLAYDYLVILKDSTKKEVNSKIYSDTSLHKNYLFLGDPDSKSDSKNKTLRIYSDQTLSICRTVTQENSSRIINIIGMANDSCWMFKVVSGAINAYSFLSEQDTDFNPLTINGIQVGNGLIENYNNENLKKLISSDAEAVKYFEKKKYYKAMVTYNNDVEKANNK